MSVKYGEKAAVRELAARRHGAGGRVEEVEVDPAEALLMGNLARSLLLYLGHRPR